MIKQGKDERYFRYCRAFGLLFFLVFIIYGNTFQASWHLDDYHNITKNPYLKITDLKPESLIQTFYAGFDKGLYPGNKISRPIPCLTFALNWYFGKENLFGYHLVNISIHFLTAFLLFLSILNLFKSPNLINKYQDSCYFIALLSAVLWAVNPIQTQAVTYIVQRMASMAAMFYILGLYLYLKARLTTSHVNRWICYLGCGLGFIFAIASKENAITFPIAVMLVEAIFFRDISQPKTRKLFFIGAIGIGIGILLIGSLLFLQGNPLFFLKGYENRLYTPLQRLMTEPRVVVFYLSQIFYPVPTRLSIEHDIAVSTSLIHPWTTMPAIIIIFALVGFGLLQMRKRPLISFALLFFFLNHAVESTVLNLELIFEHRNYLPSLFVFLPISAGFKWLFDHYRQEKPSMHVMLVSFLTLVIIGFGLGTYIRNMAWATEETLWKDAIRKAPQSSRACHNLAWGYYELSGQFDKALFLYPKCLELTPPSKSNKSLTWNNMASVYYMRKNFEKAAELWETAFRIYPEVEFLQYRLALALTKSRKFEEALTNLDELLSNRPEHTDYIILKGSVLLEQQRLEQALDYFRKALRQKPYLPEVMKNLGTVFHLMRDYKRAELYFKNAHSLNPQEPVTLLWLAATNLKLKDTADVDRYLDNLFAVISVSKLQLLLETISDPENMISSQRELFILFPLISAKLSERIYIDAPQEGHSVNKPG